MGAVSSFCSCVCVFVCVGKARQGLSLTTFVCVANFNYDVRRNLPFLRGRRTVQLSHFFLFFYFARDRARGLQMSRRCCPASNKGLFAKRMTGRGAGEAVTCTPQGVELKHLDVHARVGGLLRVYTVPSFPYFNMHVLLSHTHTHTVCVRILQT